MKNKILILILLLILIFTFRMKTYERGVFMPKQISFYGITVNGSSNMRLKYLDINFSMKYLYALFTYYNQSILEYMLKKNDKYGNNRLYIHFENRNTRDYINYEFNIKDDSWLLQSYNIDKLTTKLHSNETRKSKFLKINYQNTKKCTFPDMLTYKENEKVKKYTLTIKLNGKYKTVTISSNKKSYFNNFIDGNCKPKL